MPICGVLDDGRAARQLGGSTGEGGGGGGFLRDPAARVEVDTAPHHTKYGSVKAARSGHNSSAPDR